MLGVRQSFSDLPIAAAAVPPRAVLPVAEPAAPSFAPGACARWARAEGLQLGDVAALMVRDPSEANALRQGLAWAGVRTRDLSLEGDHTKALADATVAIVDSSLAAAYGRVLAGLEQRPPVWWNGTGADFARFDHAVAEYARESSHHERSHADGSSPAA